MSLPEPCSSDHINSEGCEIVCITERCLQKRLDLIRDQLQWTEANLEHLAQAEMLLEETIDAAIPKGDVHLYHQIRMLATAVSTVEASLDSISYEWTSIFDIFKPEDCKKHPQGLQRCRNDQDILRSKSNAVVKNCGASVDAALQMHFGLFFQDNVVHNGTSLRLMTPGDVLCIPQNSGVVRQNSLFKTIELWQAYHKASYPRNHPPIVKFWKLIEWSQRVMPNPGLEHISVLVDRSIRDSACLQAPATKTQLWLTAQRQYEPRSSAANSGDGTPMGVSGKAGDSLLALEPGLQNLAEVHKPGILKHSSNERREANARRISPLSLGSGPQRSTQAHVPADLTRQVKPDYLRYTLEDGIIGLSRQLNRQSMDDGSQPFAS